MASDGGKGSAPRPYSIAKDTFSDNWERTFGKNKSTVPMPGTIGSAELIFKDETRERNNSVQSNDRLDS